MNKNRDANQLRQKMGLFSQSVKAQKVVDWMNKERAGSNLLPDKVEAYSWTELIFFVVFNWKVVALGADFWLWRKVILCNTLHSVT